MRTEAPIDLVSAAIKYNPHLWGPEELRAIFVVRQTDLADIVAAVRDTPVTQVPQHILVCGHCGMGKSTLLRRLALAINETPELSAQWLPLVFPEEQYTVRTLAEFWLNVLDALADALEQAGALPEELAILDARVGQIAALPSEQAEKAAIELLTRWVADHQRGLVLLIDSSDLLLNSLAHGEGKAAKHAGNANALWRLRNVLSHQPGLFWIGASYQALESQHQYQDAFHDFFAQHELRPLDLTEMRSAMLALARHFGAGRGLQGEAAEREMARILDTRPERLKTLRLLSGGNPRTMVTLYELFAAGGDDSIQADLKRLLDIMTPLYKARMEALSEQPQKIFAHLMESWSPIGVRELAAAAGIPATTVSGQLARLEVEGLIEKARLPGKTKRNGYQASERFFNAWYLMRYGTRRLRQRLTWAVQFMRLWFSRAEPSSMAGVRSGLHAMALDGRDPYPTANLARQAGALGRREEASNLYRTALALIESGSENPLLQAHLWLGNLDSARQALAASATAASNGDGGAFFRLREQCWECEQLGLGSALAELMNTSPWADFLQPFSLALTAAAAGEPPVGAPPEILSLAEEVLEEIRHRRSQIQSTKSGAKT